MFDSCLSQVMVTSPPWSRGCSTVLVTSLSLGLLLLELLGVLLLGVLLLGVLLLVLLGFLDFAGSFLVGVSLFIRVLLSSFLKVLER